MSKTAKDSTEANELFMKRLQKLAEQQPAPSVQPDPTFASKVRAAFAVAAAAIHAAAKYTGPLYSAAAWTAGKLRDIFMFSAFEREDGKYKLDADGDLIFSGRRLARMSGMYAATALAAWMAVSAAYFHGTKFDELVYVTGKQELVQGEEYQFSGCTSLPCSTESDNAKYYKIESSLMFPTVFYPEEDVYAPIPTVNGACHVEGYGIYFRSARFLFKSLDWWQHAYAVSCRPLSDAEVQQSLGTGTVPDAIGPVTLPQQAAP